MLFAKKVPAGCIRVTDLDDCFDTGEKGQTVRLLRFAAKRHERLGDTRTAANLANVALTLENAQGKE